MQEQNNNKTITIAAALLLFIFYCAIAAFILFHILQINLLENFVCGMIFEAIGTIILFVIIFGNIVINKKLKTGCFVPIVIVTLIYTVLLNIYNMLLIAVIPATVFFLLHMVLLFVFLLIVIPIYLIGIR